MKTPCFQGVFIAHLLQRKVGRRWAMRLQGGQCSRRWADGDDVSIRVGKSNAGKTFVFRAFAQLLTFFKSQI
jgi:hypothetical protein